MLPNIVQLLVQVRLDVDAHIFCSLHHQRLVNQTTQQILLLFLELRINLILRAALAIARHFLPQLLFGFLIVGERDGVAVHSRDDVGGDRILALRAQADGDHHRDNRRRHEGTDGCRPDICHEVHSPRIIPPRL